MSVPHLPAVRAGRAYESADRIPIPDYRTGAPLGLVSQVNGALVRRDLLRAESSPAPLAEMPVTDVLQRLRRAGDLFLEATLPAGAEPQSPEVFLRQVSGSTGLPIRLVGRHMQRIADLCRHLGEVLRGLSREDDLTVLDGGWARRNGSVRAFSPVVRTLGVVMPSNSPGVNSLWLPAVGLKVGVAIKPGRDDPWTPYRLLQALAAAGIPDGALGYYPAGHDGAAALLETAGRSLLFGDDETTGPWRGDPRVEIHGPGRSKVLVGEEFLDAAETLDVCVASILENSGRSCTNASTIIVARDADRIAGALAERLGGIVPLPAEDGRAALAAFVRPETAERISAAIDRDLAADGAHDVTAGIRGAPRLVRAHGGTYLLPTIVRCASFGHPLANREYLFPFASVVEVPERQMADVIGPSLVVTALTRDPEVTRALLRAAHIGRLHLGPIPTWEVAWDQPHEGNVFELLYRRRALRVAESLVVSSAQGPGTDGG